MDFFGTAFISVISTLISGASFAWGIWVFVINKKEKAHQAELERIYKDFEDLKTQFGMRINDLEKALNRNTEQFISMKEVFAVYKTKLEEVDKNFDKRMDRFDRDIQRIDSRLEHVDHGRVIRKD